MTHKLISTPFSSVDGMASDPLLFQYDSFDGDLVRRLAHRGLLHAEGQCRAVYGPHRD